MWDKRRLSFKRQSYRTNYFDTWTIGGSTNLDFHYDYFTNTDINYFVYL